MASPLAWIQRTGGLRIRIRLTPKSSRDGIDGTTETADGPAIAARVRAVPEDGKANAAAEKLIADWLDLPRSSVVLAGGQKSRVKLLDVDGSPSELASQIEALLAAGPKPKTKGRST